MDPFDVLYLTPDAPPEVITAAYRALAKLHHPDARGVAPRMVAINAAYEQLRDPDQRALLAMHRRSSATMPPSALVRMPWGKHAGQRLADVPTDYLLWVVANVAGRPELVRDARAVLRWREMAA